MARRSAKSLSELKDFSRPANLTPAARAESTSSSFRSALAQLGPVAPITVAARVTHAPDLPPPLPLQRQADDRAVLHESVTSAFSIDTLLEADDSLSFRQPGVGPEVLRKLRRGDWVIQGELDLHGLRVEAAHTAVQNFLRQAVQNGRRCLRIVHGKGLRSVAGQPVLKGKVKSWLVHRAEVLAFCQARPAEGGSGALLVLLRPRPKPNKLPK
jgi:DNA-nicking Smr family endonuclease